MRQTIVLLYELVLLCLLCLGGTATGYAKPPLKPALKVASVQVFVSSVCPISNGYAPELQRLYRDYHTKGIAFDAVNSADPDSKTALDHAARFGLTGYRVVPDPKQTVARKAGVTATPEVAVWDAKGTLRYRGRIDDRYAALGVRRETARTPDLRNALDALIAGKPVPVPRTRAVGCVLPTVTDEETKP